jgi:hypothetical protein
MNLITAYVRQIPRPVLVSVAVAAVVVVLYLRRMSVSAPVAKALAVYPAGPRARFTALFAAFEARGYKVVITSTVRPGEGRHGSAHACDVNVLDKHGKQFKMATPKAEWEATGLPALAISMGFRWGGNFTSPYLHNGVWKPGYDPVHFDFA